AVPFLFDINAEAQRKKEVENSDIVISLLPPPLHPLVARECVEFRKNLVTASYVSDAMRSLDEEARKNGILLLNETGLDPGIDHISAMHIIERIKEQGGELKSFKSYTGGLLSPEYNNPWGYKFTWNPRNVI